MLALEGPVHGMGFLPSVQLASGEEALTCGHVSDTPQRSECEHAIYAVQICDLGSFQFLDLLLAMYCHGLTYLGSEDGNLYHCRQTENG